MSVENLAFIGAGHMAQALIRALIKEGFPPQNIFASNPSSQKLEILQNETGIQITPHNALAAKNAGVIIFCVKPQQLSSVCNELKALILKKKPLIISIAAGARLDFFSDFFQHKIPIIRSMPNIPALVSAGATALCRNALVDAMQQKMAERLFRSVGLIAWVEEAQMDAITALSGSGPAYIFLIMEILQSIGESFGLTSENAKLLTLQTVFGAAKLALESENSFSSLRKSVTSPHGTTAAAIKIFEEGHLAELFSQALRAAKTRAQELSSEL